MAILFDREDDTSHAHDQGRKIYTLRNVLVFFRSFS